MKPLEVDLADFDADEGQAVARMVDELRGLTAGGRRVIVRNCPQMLAHTLYKAGILARGEVELDLDSVRREEPYG